jgi:hypothetical protein
MAWTGVPITAGFDYSVYLGLGGNADEDTFTRLLPMADETIRRVTFGRSLDGFDERVAMARTATINALNEYGAFSSERLGSYTYTRRNIGQADVDRAAVDALSGTGLTYRGVAWNTTR